MTVTETIPIIYTSTVVNTCIQRHSSQGANVLVWYLSSNDKGKIRSGIFCYLTILCHNDTFLLINNWPRIEVSMPVTVTVVRY